MKTPRTNCIVNGETFKLFHQILKLILDININIRYWINIAYSHQSFNYERLSFEAFRKECRKLSSWLCREEEFLKQETKILTIRKTPVLLTYTKFYLYTCLLLPCFLVSSASILFRELWKSIMYSSRSYRRWRCNGGFNRWSWK